MNQDDAFYDIPSVPKFADLTRVALGECDASIGDDLFDMTGVVVGGMPGNKENEAIEGPDESNFGINQLAMFRAPQRRQRAMSVEAPRREQARDRTRARSIEQNRRAVPLLLHTAVKSRPAGLVLSSGTEQRLNKANPALYHGPETRLRSRLDKRAIISSTLKPLSNNNSRPTARPANRRSTTELIQMLSLKEKPSAPSSTRGVVVKPDPAGHVPRPRTRREPVNKGPLRMNPSRVMPDVRSERHFRESVTRRQRGGDSLEKKSNPTRPSQPQPTMSSKRRSSVRMTEAERAAMFARLSTPRSITAKHSVTERTPKSKRSLIPATAHPSTKGLRARVVRTRSSSLDK